jgi:hypothetical protein
MAKQDTTTAVLNQSNKLVKLSTAPENISVSCEVLINCYVYLFTSDSANPTPPPAGSANLLKLGDRQTYGDPFSVWAFVKPSTTSATYSANLVYEKWDS